MFDQRLRSVLLAALALMLVRGAGSAQQQSATPGSGDAAAAEAPAGGADFGSRAAYARARGLRGASERKVWKAQLEPHWFDDGRRFWYRNDVRGEKEFIAVDVERGARGPAFDHRRLAVALAQALGELGESGEAVEAVEAVDAIEAERLPFDRIRFVQDLSAIEFDTGGAKWSCDLRSYECAKVGAADPPEPRAGRGRRGGPRDTSGRRGRGRRGGPVASPDGAWTVESREHDLYLRSPATGEEVRLTEDGTEALEYGGPLSWSPDSKRLVAHRVAPSVERLVHYVESSPDDQIQPKHTTRVYAKPGDVITTRKPVLFDVGARQRIDVDDALFRQPYQNQRLRWRPDGSAFTFEYNQRGHQVYRVIEVDAASGAARAILEEDCATFFDYNHKYYRHDVGADGAEIIWMSERDGWNHLYLFDGRTGELQNRITQGEWVVRGVDFVDDEARQIWFRASGRNPGEDPYHVHFYRVSFDGTGLVALTEGDGTHSVQLSPDRTWLIDSFSRVDEAPVHVLRRASDGGLVTELETADVGDLLATGWRWPEPFVAKGRDGATDIWGVCYRPIGLDPALRYPIVESIYAGPQGSHVPKGFSAHRSGQALAELGFVVVQIDGMGTSNRSRAFHHFCHRNLADAGLPDRIAWLRALAAAYPYVDLERVGVYGNSAGGQNAAGALFDHGDSYKVGVASCGCHDNRMDKLWWNEMWMGYPVGPHYEEQSNVTKAHKLEGKLLLIVGELDTNVDPASTMQVVDALIEADKDFDLLVVPGGGHGNGGAYGTRRTWDFFVRHLHGVEPRHE